MIKILQLTDLHIQPKPTDVLLGVNTEQYFHQVLQHAHQHHGTFDLILITGDLAQDPCRTSYQRILRQLESYQTPTLCLPGNHDDYPMMQEIFNQDAINCRKLLILKGWQIIGLNSQKSESPNGYLNQDELCFLTNCLNNNLPSLIAVHHHSLPTGSSWMDGMMIENHRAFLALLTEHPQVKILTHGHVHQTIATTFDGVAVFSAPASCIQFMPNATEFTVTDTPPGYRVFELYVDGGFSSLSCHLEQRLTELQINAHRY